MNGKTDLKNLLARHKVLALDTTPFIYQLEQNPKYSLLTEVVFNHLEEASAVTSTTTLAEILSKKDILRKRKVWEFLKAALKSIPNLTYLPVSLEVAEKSAILRIKYGLRLPDAFQLSTAVLFGSTIFITNDEKFRKVKDLKVVILDDFL